jgi:hypothetical protein
MKQQFKVGERVIALDSCPETDPSRQPRVKGKIYEVKAVLYCSGCGSQKINIGYNSLSTSGQLRCDCNKRGDAEGLKWTNSSHFAKLDNIDNLIKEAVEDEDYELAATLRDLQLEEQNA